MRMNELQQVRSNAVSPWQLYLNCLMWTVGSTVPFIVLLMHNYMHPGNAIGQTFAMCALLATYTLLSVIFQIRFTTSRADRLLCAISSYVLFIMGIGAIIGLYSRLVGEPAWRAIIWSCEWFIGNSGRLALAPSIWLFGPVLAIAIARCFFGPQPARVTRLGCGQHAAPAAIAQQAEENEDCIIKTNAPHTVRAGEVADA